MKHRFIFGTFLLLFTATAFGISESDDLPSADALVARMLAHNVERQGQLAGYHGMRRYVLENDRMNKHAEMVVRVEGDADETKHFEVVSEEGWKAAQKHVLQRMLATESEASSPEIRLKTRLSPENYKFHMAQTALLGDRMAYVIDVVPRRRDERLFEGQIWIDAQDYALARVEGKPAKNPSFWTSSVHFVHTYQKSGPFWFPVSTESVTEVRIFGATSLTIHYFDYIPNRSQATETASAVSAGGHTQ
ncbi:hypothetical protein [Edaphobacter aggregans]|uniref:hypothetical protein n=1 Tax=Edaphobacter aggregans TaxID=570835 RepID=UPI0005592735|nr:hypothetical protein [Edaphobacter aggregans]